jgi:hypothetical protein
MFVYANNSNKTCQIIDTPCLIDALTHVKDKKGTLYFTEDNENSDNVEKELTQDELDEAMVWHNGHMTKLGKTLFDNSNFRNLID